MRNERGIALPASLAVLFMVAGLATVTARAAITSDHQSLRDRNVKQALQAANAGLAAAMYRTNLMQPGSLQCAYKPPSAGALTVGALEGDGWCQEQVEELGEGASYSMRISGAQALHANGQALSRRTAVSTGIVNGVRRRLRLQMNAATGEPVFAQNYAIVSLNGLTLPNSVRINGGVGSNGNILLRNSAHACGDVTPGPGKSVSINNSATICDGSDTTAATESFNLQPVDQGTAPTDNDNARIGNPPATNSPDPCTDCTGIEWDPATRILRLRNNSTLTLGGGVYSFCGIEVENTAQFKIAVRPLGTGIRLFIDSPENCGGAGTGSVRVRNAGTILNLNTDPTTFQMMVVGSADIATEVAFDNNVDFASNLVMAVYAPHSTIRMQGAGHLVGAVAARSIDLRNSSQITYHERIADITTGNPLRLFKPEHYIECTAVPTGPTPESGC
jgi:type II secretory pathway pseudopilin PulG